MQHKMRKLILLSILFITSNVESQVSITQPRNGGTGLTAYTIGDIIYASGTTSFTRLNIGSSGQTLIVSGGIPTWSTIAVPASISFNYPLSITSNTVSLLYGTGLSLSTNTLIVSGITNANLSGSAGITNANLANSTISGISLGNNLANLTNGYGILGGTYNGSSAISLRTDTSCSSCPASKLYLAAKLGTGTVTSFSYTNGNGFTGTVNNASTTPTLSLSLQNATTSQSGQLTSTDWNTFNNKQNALTNPITGTGTSGQAAFFTGSTMQSSDAAFFWDNTNKRFALGGTTSPVSILHTIETSTSTVRGINSDQYSAAGGSRITMRVAGGTAASPSTVATGRPLASWTSQAHDGTNFIDAAKILITSAGTVGTGSVPATMALQTANSAGVLTTGLSIDQSQNIAITNSVTAGALIKSGGTSSQFLKADGSTDANSYITNTVTTLSSLSSIGTVTTGVWNATKIGLAYGGTNTDLSAGGAVGDIIQGATSTTFSRLASGAVGTILRSTGTGSVVAYSTATYPNTITSTNVLYASGTNAIGSTANMQYDGTRFFTLTSPTANTGGIRLSSQSTINGYLMTPDAGWGNYPGTTISADNSLLMVAGNGAGTGLKKLFLNYSNLYVTTGTVASNIGFNTNTTGIFIDRIDNIGTASTAKLHIGAGTASANTAPLKFTSGTNLTTTEAGAVEYNGTHLFFTATNSGTRYQLDQQGVSNYSHNISTPTTGGTVNLIVNQFNIINPVGALLALTVALPSSPSNNDVVYIKYTQNITTVTYSNGTVADGITAPTAGGLVVLVYDSGTTTWY